MSLPTLLRRFRRDDRGQDLIEYSFLAVFVALAVTVGVQAVGTAVNQQFTGIAERTAGS
jgi:Flp pilus assembly pilin Flp